MREPKKIRFTKTKPIPSRKETERQFLKDMWVMFCKKGCRTSGNAELDVKLRKMFGEFSPKPEPTLEPRVENINKNCICDSSQVIYYPNKENA
jgi:hypothetical protein